MLTYELDLSGSMCSLLTSSPPSSGTMGRSAAARWTAVLDSAANREDIAGGAEEAAADGAVSYFFGALSGVPTGNGSFVVKLGRSGKPRSLLVYSPIGTMDAMIQGATKSSSTSSAGGWCA